MIISTSLKKRKNKLIKSLIKRPLRKPTKSGVKQFNELINKEEMDVNRVLFQNFFKLRMPSAMLSDLYNTNSKRENNALVNVIKSRLVDLKNEIEKISENETEIKEPYEMADIVEKNLHFNKQKQEGQGLKILTTEQILRRLTTSLAQLKAGNNSEKLKSEIRQLLYSLYRSRKLSKTIYNNLISTI